MRTKSGFLSASRVMVRSRRPCRTAAFSAGAPASSSSRGSLRRTLDLGGDAIAVRQERAALRDDVCPGVRSVVTNRLPSRSPRTSTSTFLATDSSMHEDRRLLSPHLRREERHLGRVDRVSDLARRSLPSFPRGSRACCSRGRPRSEPSRVERFCRRSAARNLARHSACRSRGDGCSRSSSAAPRRSRSPGRTR